MTVELNHTIIWCKDKMRSSAFLAEMLGRPEPVAFMHFMVVDLDNDVSVDFMEQEGAIALQHYAYLVDDATFDAVHERIRDRGIDHWADPARTMPNAINRYFGGRGVYFLDPDGHMLEAMTRPYARDEAP
ncbi:glyoxalase/bleomycin resistance protein/dioxygenase [Sphingomonas sp. SRS2]|nr:glyoxalase/bleomycin resistance protein/dioxygenase [Sphingomonas sp. SRS2]